MTMYKYSFLSLIILMGCTSVKTSTSSQSTNETRLHDIWALKELNGRTLTPANFKEAPYLEINVAEKRVMGNSSCNQFSGHVEITGDKIKFGQMISTRMACVQSVETEFLKMLEDSESYKFDGLYLILLKSDKEIGKLLKVD